MAQGSTANKNRGKENNQDMQQDMSQKNVYTGSINNRVSSSKG